MANDFTHDGENAGKIQTQNIHEALRAIKENQCEKCGTQAKGFVYRGKTAIYYCKDCLHELLV